MGEIRNIVLWADVGPYLVGKYRQQIQDGTKQFGNRCDTRFNGTTKQCEIFNDCGVVAQISVRDIEGQVCTCVVLSSLHPETEEELKRCIASMELPSVQYDKLF